MIQSLQVRLKSVFNEKPLGGLIVHLPPVGGEAVEMS